MTTPQWLKYMRQFRRLRAEEISDALDGTRLTHRWNRTWEEQRFQWRAEIYWPTNDSRITD